jgi:hypothetical protein
MTKIMKSKPQYLTRLFSAVVLGVAGITVILLTAGKPRVRYVAHEWGTFTSVQGGDGALLDWRPLESSRLPKFVYNWQNPGLGRFPSSSLILGKGGLTARQRMETPVMYFYSNKRQSVDVSVHFPQGLITEWYPQAARIGPSTIAAGPWVAKLDSYAHRLGMGPGFSFDSWWRKSATKDSEADWTRVEILPPKDETSSAAFLAADRSGSHYFTARDTEANLLRVPSLVSTNPTPEYEKFLFYRGVGNFSTPLRITMESNDRIILNNDGEENVSYLFVLRVENGDGSFLPISDLKPAEKRQISLEKVREPIDSLTQRLGASLAKALENEGLYAQEATAMVKTWNDSWFQEDGVRVLYVLPRGWTDRTLPLTLDPAPQELTRVMVGRAEVLTPGLERQLSNQLAMAARGDADARELARSELAKLGRFAEPAFRLALQGSSPEVSQAAWPVYQAALNRQAGRTGDL